MSLPGVIPATRPRCGHVGTAVSCVLWFIVFNLFIVWSHLDPEVKFLLI